MSSISSLDTVRPATTEDDITQTPIWALDPPSTLPDKKGKHKQTSTDSANDDSDSNSYPPISDQEAETKRVEETLRRWELAERQRRKAVRESTSGATSLSTSPSLLRRASLLWNGNSRRRTLSSSITGKHAALGSTDNLETVPLEDIQSISPIPSCPTSPTPSGPKHTSASDGTENENPFEEPTTPTASDAISPFADSHAVNVRPQKSSKSKSRQISTRQSIPPPMPLDLPPPKSPPPLVLSSPLSPEPRQSIAPNGAETEDEKPVRWWHEWLCGCGEGPDRGGDYQAGRTNPAE